MRVVPPEARRIADRIRTMGIRGAGEIARSAVGALMIVAKASKATSVNEFVDELDYASKLLLETRPTAVSLPNGIRYVMHRVHQSRKMHEKLDEIRSVAIQAGEEFIASSKTAIQRIGHIGANRIRNGDVLLTHCNSSAVITILKTAWEQGKRIQVFVTETRPRFQGWITAKALGEVGIPVTLIPDGAVRFFMDKVDRVIVGADAVTANGAVVNKIGTSMIALAAHEARVRFFVAAETYKFSPETMIGELVKIEERDTLEVLPSNELKKMPNVNVRNPSFDITPPEYIDIIITEKGIIPPQGAILVLQETFGVLTPEELKDYQTYQIGEEF